MPDPDPLERIWIGKDERGGIPVPERNDVPPPPDWRLEAIAHDVRPRSLTVGPDARTAVFIEDRDTSDLHVLDLGTDGAAPERLTTGRKVMPYWEDTQPRISPDGTTVAYGQGGDIWLVPVTGGVPRRLVEGGGPVWLDDARLLVSIEHEIETVRTTRMTVVNVADPFPRRLARDHDDLDALGDEEDPTVSPDGAEVAYVFVPRDDLKRAEIRVVDVVTGRSARSPARPAWPTPAPPGRPTARRSPTSPSAPVAARSMPSAARATPTARSPATTPTSASSRGSPAASGSPRCAAGATASTSCCPRGRRGGRAVAPGGTWDRPAWTAAGDLVAGYEDHATPAELRRIAPGEPHRTIHAPAPLSVKRARHVAPEDVSFRSFDGLEIPAFLFRPANASADAPVAAVVYPHGGPTDAYIDDHDPRAQYFLAKGYAWLAVNFRGSTGYGRDFERLNHGTWGVDDTKDCLAAADYLRGLDWVDGDRLAIVGGSYGSYMATLAVTDDPEHRYRCAVAMYGDVDLVTSWAQGDRLGVQDLERMMGPPSAARAAYRAASAVHRLANVEAPILIAHGERDDRVSPRQSEEHVAELRRLGKTFEYVTYPTEAHGFLRSGPNLDFNRRLERFLDWYLM